MENAYPEKDNILNKSIESNFTDFDKYLNNIIYSKSLDEYININTIEPNVKFDKALSLDLSNLSYKFNDDPAYVLLLNQAQRSLNQTQVVNKTLEDQAAEQVFSTFTQLMSRFEAMQHVEVPNSVQNILDNLTSKLELMGEKFNLEELTQTLVYRYYTSRFVTAPLVHNWVKTIIEEFEASPVLPSDKKI